MMETDREALMNKLRRVRWPGYVYAAEINGRFTKIGFSSQIDRRFAQHRLAFDRIELLMAHPGTRADERGWHERFKDYRVRNEIFDLPADLRRHLVCWLSMGRHSFDSLA